MNRYDLVIVGSGAAGLAAALYAGRYKMKTLVVEGAFGGETATAGSIENYPGIQKIDGYEFMKAMKGQAAALGVEFEDGWVEKVEKEGECFRVLTKGREFRAATVILAIGSRRRHLGLAREEELTGRGVHYCWTCDGPLYGGKTVAMVGGGDSSVKGVNFLAEYANKVYLIVRDKKVRAEPVNEERMKGLGDKVEVILETEVQELRGEKKLEKLLLSRPHKGLNELPLDAVFIEIGFDPDTRIADQLGIKTDEKKYLLANNMMETSLPGVFAAGDGTNHFGRFKQDITAAALGAVAATSAYEYLASHPEACRDSQKTSQ
ncbi:MAG: FAD-dependent oxidoreductase [bacterium]|nr:FAD-dependent oxidoreductase [bacterium]MDZ4231731.1 FAD-dependent oxidoreductase [Candidatus Pacearchaeota archaeon]